MSKSWVKSTSDSNLTIWSLRDLEELLIKDLKSWVLFLNWSSESNDTFSSNDIIELTIGDIFLTSCLDLSPTKILST